MPTVIRNRGTPRGLSLHPALCMSVLGESLHLLCSPFHPLPLSSPSTLHPLLHGVSCFPRAVACSALCGLSLPPGCFLVQLPRLLSACLVTYSLQVAQNSMGLICLFTPSHIMDCTPGRSLAAVGSSAHLWSDSWKGGHLLHPHSPCHPQKQGHDQDGYLRKGVGVPGFYVIASPSVTLCPHLS